MGNGPRADSLPSGRLTFLFTDIEGSTRLLDQLGPAYVDAMSEHARIIREAIARHDGREVNTEGDSFFAVFRLALQAIRAAADIQRGLSTHPFPKRPVRVRIGIHSGEATLSGRDYIGLDVNRAARIAAAGHGGQVLLSGATKELAGQSLEAAEDGLGLRDLGSHRLRDLPATEHLYQLLVDDLPGDFPALRTLESVPSNVPEPLTRFFGRRSELAQTRELLRTSRLLTLTGPGGSGKTRLALQLAKDSLGSFADGVYFVPLAALREPKLVLSAVASAVGIAESGSDVRDILASRLADRDVLLVVDNFEQLLPAAQELSAMLTQLPRLKLIVTSRSPLGIYGEREYGVPPLDVPDPERLPPLQAAEHLDSVALFVDRARAVRPDFELTRDNYRAIAEICVRLDGLPLAIELAAARTKLMTPDAMLVRLNDRLRLLSGAARDLPERQRTLRATIGWSYDLLSEQERETFARLSVFLGGAALPLVAQVLEIDELEALDRAASLVDKSLLRAVDHDETRFEMLETIREYAAERLAQTGGADALRRRHALAFASLAEEAATHLLSERGGRWLDRLETEHNNFRAAYRWSLDLGDPKIALQLVAALWRFWQMRGHLREGRERAEEALRFVTDIEPRVRAAALTAAGGIAYWQADFAGARSHYDESLALYQQLADDAGVAEALYNLSFTYFVTREDPEHGRELAARSLDIYRRLGDRAGIANTLWALGGIEIAADPPRLELALANYAEAAQLFESVGNRPMLAWAHFQAGAAEARRGSHHNARGYLIDALKQFAELHDVSGFALVVDGLAKLAWASGKKEEAARLSAVAGRLEETTGVMLTENTAGQWFPDFDRETLREENANAWAAGEAADPEAVVAALVARS